MKTMKILFTLVVFVMMGLTVSAQAKKDTTVIFKVGIHCPSCKAKLDKDMPFEKGIKDYKLNMKDSTVLISFRTDKNSVEALRAAIERHDVKVVGMCDKDGKLMKCGKAHKCCKEGNKEWRTEWRNSEDATEFAANRYSVAWTAPSFIERR